MPNSRIWLLNVLTNEFSAVPKQAGRVIIETFTMHHAKRDKKLLSPAVGKIMSVHHQFITQA